MAGWLPQRIFYLLSGLYFGAVFLRSLLIYNGTQELLPALALLVLMLALFISEPAITSRWRVYFPLYLTIQTLLLLILLARLDSPDFFAVLAAIFCMQAMQHFNVKVGVAWIAILAFAMVLLLVKEYGMTQAVALSLTYTAGNVLMGAYTLAMRRASLARQHNQALTIQLQEANRQLQAYSIHLEQLAIARERNRLARELHDSVTQTVFSMTLTTQSALLVLARNPPSAREYLERLYQLARSALAEMQLLVSELRPDRPAREGLASTLRRHLASSHIPENLSVSLEVEGDGPLAADEELGLFRIAEEALNNIVKHAQTSQAQIRLHLAEPFWIEIEDQGQGFDLTRARSGEGFGLSSMAERAAEIGWALNILTSPGAGACIRVEKAPVREVQR